MKPKEFPAAKFEDVEAELLLEESIYDEVEDVASDVYFSAGRREQRAGWED